MNLSDFEDKIITKLDSDLTESVTVESYPDDFDQYISQLKNRNGAVLTVWQGAFFDPSEGNNEKTLVQNAVYTWQFTVLQKSLKRTKQQYGLYAIVEEIRTILSGFTPAGFDDSSVLEPVESGFLEKIHGFYVYQITFAHRIDESEL